MNEFLYHWIWIDIYTPVWPNIVAAVLCAGFVDLRNAKRHEELIRLHSRKGRENE
jgi:hypothetical protein